MTAPHAHHPAAAIFPLMGLEELESLAQDIATHGQREPIELLNGLVLDGRNRQAACMRAGVTPLVCELEEIESPVAYVLSKNLHRRHLTPSQRAAIAVEALPLFEAEARERQRLSEGRGRKGRVKLPDLPPGEFGQARDKAAATTGASPRYVSDAKRLKAEHPDLYEQVRQGGVSLAEAKREAKRLKAEQDAATVQFVVDAAPDDGGRLAAATLRAAYSRAVVGTHKLQNLDAEQIAPLLDVPDAERARWFIRDLRAWLDRFDAALANHAGIHLVRAGEG